VANLGNNSNAGESPVGILLRAASRELYWDGITDRHKTIFTHGLLAEVFTKSRVLSSLCFESAESRGYSPDRCFCLIRGGGQPNELGEFGRVFALLLLCNMPQHIFRFFAHGLCDKAFPFTEGTEDGTIRSKTLDGSKEDLQLGWTSQCCESFVTQQYRIFLPYFSEGHQRFEKDTIMPWYDYHTRTTGSTSSTSASTAGGGSAPSGGHSDVSRVAIHDGYHNFNTVRGVSFKTFPCSGGRVGTYLTSYLQAPGSGHVLTFAIKKLRTTNEDVFNREVAMLRSLGGKRPHTVELLATFRYAGIYSLIFPWAECDLLAYWQRGLGQGMSGPLIIWAVSQCSGLVSALEWIHNPTTVLDPENNELFGRHGDIKPENILWYKQNSDGLHPLASGELVLSDFGLSSLNHKNTRSNIINGGILHTTTYAPPESVLPDNVISQSIDIWALGCVYLEFVTWIIGGPTLFGKFQSARLAPFLGSPIGNDIFWEVQEFENPGTGKSSYVTVVKPKVVEVCSTNQSPAHSAMLWVTNP